MKHGKPIFKTMVVKTATETGSNGRTRVVASAPTADRYNDIVASDWNLDSFKNVNPVVLWAHDYSTPAIGRVTDIGVEGKTLVAEIEWDTHDTNKLGQIVASQFARGFCNAVSVGFTPGETVERASLDKDDEHYSKSGNLYRNCELMELSAVPIPAHRDALAMRSFGPGVARHIWDVVDNGDSFTITFGKKDEMIEDHDDTEAAEDADEVVVESYEDDDDKMKEHEPGHDEDAPDDEDEPEDDEDEDEDDEDAIEARSFMASTDNIKPIVRAALLELIGDDPALMERKPTKVDALASLFGIDK